MRWRRAWIHSRRERCASESVLRRDVGGSKQTVVTDLDETRGQHVLDEAVEEGDGSERCGLAFLGAEGDATRIEGDESVIGDADAVGVATEVAQHLLGSTEWAFGVEDRRLAKEGGAKVI